MSDADFGAHNWAEDLPTGCPTTDAKPLQEQLLIRLAHDDVPTKPAFWSFTKLGKPVRGGASDCAYASCSMFARDDADEMMNALRTLPKFRRFSHAFVTRIKPDSGVGQFGKRGHVDMWFYASFDAPSAVEAVEVL